MSVNPETYVFYWNGPFSQWQYAEFSVSDVAFSSAEQAMMYYKAELFDDLETAAKILLSDEPGKQKALGRVVQKFDETIWDEHKQKIVYGINFAKFDQNKGLRRKLFQTGRGTLAEASPLDTIWGIGLDEKTARQTLPHNWPGQNLLGKILTEVREELRLIYPEEASSVNTANFCW